MGESTHNHDVPRQALVIPEGEPQTHPSATTPESEPLIAALIEIERHVGKLGWDQPSRLFALVRTDELIRAEPTLADHLVGGNPDSLSSIEQEDFREGKDILSTLRGIQWPATVYGTALSMERSFLPPQFEKDVPEDPEEAATFVAKHPHKLDIRVVVGALRDGTQHGVARMVNKPDDLLGGEDLVPGLAQILLGTLQ